MAVEWQIKGTEICNCNCDFGCPCQFNSMPTHGNCQGILGFDIKEGHFGTVRLDGLRAILMCKYPGAIHEGNGTIQVIVDERADAAQREALLKIMTGAETEEMATVLWVYSAMAPNKLEPLFRPIELEADIDKRTARLRVPGIVEMTAEPIRNPVTGAEHRARVELPHGIEFHVAELGAGTTKTTGPLALSGLSSSHAHFARIHLSNAGVLE
jgi:hypothetical protein